MDEAVRVWRLLPDATRRSLAGVALLSVLSSVAELATFAALAAFLRSWANAGPDVARFAMLFAAFALASAGVRWWLQVRTARLSADASHALSVEANRRLLAQPLAFHHQFHSASAAATLEKVRAMSGAVLLPLVRMAQSLLIGFALLVATLATLPSLALLALGAVGLAYALIVQLVGRSTRRRERGLAARFDERARIVQESFAGIRDIILDRLAASRVARFAEVDRDIQQRLAVFQGQAATPRLLIEGIGMAVIALLIAALANGRAAEAIAPIGLIAFAAQRLLPLAHSAASGWQGWIANRGTIDDVSAVLSLPLDEPHEGPPLPFERAVGLEGVSFAYPGGPPVIDGLSLSLAKGSRTGLRGPTGAGKSTIADLVMALLDPSKGTLTVDGQPIGASEAARWQANIAHVGQHLFLLDASIAENVALGRSAIDRSRVREALVAAALDEFSDRLDDHVGEGGVRISGGQRQRLALARAHYKNAPFWVLDEATSALDSVTERRVLRNIPPGTTVLAISHRPAALANCDRIFVLEDGILREATD